MQHSFTAMFREWLHREGIRQRLLAYEDGERRLTDLCCTSQAVVDKQMPAREPLVLAQAGLRRRTDFQISFAWNATKRCASSSIEQRAGIRSFSARSPGARRTEPEAFQTVYFHRQQPTENGRREHVCDFDSPEREEHARRGVPRTSRRSLRLLRRTHARAEPLLLRLGCFQQGRDLHATSLIVRQVLQATLRPRWTQRSNRSPTPSCAATSSGSLTLQPPAAQRQPSCDRRPNPQRASVSPACAAGSNSAPRAWTHYHDWRRHQFLLAHRQSARRSAGPRPHDLPNLRPCWRTRPSPRASSRPLAGAAAGRGRPLRPNCLSSPTSQTPIATPRSGFIRDTLIEHGFSAKFTPAVHESLRRTCHVALDPIRGQGTSRLPRRHRPRSAATSPDLAAQLQRLNFKPTGGSPEGLYRPRVG